MNKRYLNKIENDKEYQNIIKEYIKNDTVQEMNKYIQHCDTSCFEHCYSASYKCYKIAKKLGWDYKSAARGAMLHDLFLYDWRIKGDRKGLHAYTHGKASLENASKLFNLNDIEKDMILNHMWPVTVRIPKAKETFLLTAVDKYCAIAEMIEYLYEKIIRNREFRYACNMLLILCLMF